MAYSYITSNTDIIEESGSTVQIASPNIYVTPVWEPFTLTWRCTLGFTGASPTTVVREYTMRLTKATVDAKTGTGTGDTEKCINAILQCVKDYLLALNGSTTFTIT